MLTTLSSVVTDFAKYFDEMSSQIRDKGEAPEEPEFVTTEMPWMANLKPLPRSLGCQHYVKFHEDDLPNSYSTLLAAAARLVGSGPSVIQFLIKSYFEHDNTDATIDRILYRIQD